MKVISEGTAYRKYQNELIVTGTGTILFGVWTIVKAVLMVILRTGASNPELTSEAAEAAAQSERELEEALSALPPWILALFFLVLFGIIILDLFFRFYVGINARREGYGKRRPRRYLALAVIFAVLFGITVVGGFPYYFQGEDGILHGIVTLMIDVTCLSTLIALIRAAVMLRRLRRKRAIEE